MCVVANRENAKDAKDTRRIEGHCSTNIEHLIYMLNYKNTMCGNTLQLKYNIYSNYVDHKITRDMEAGVFEIYIRPATLVR